MAPRNTLQLAYERLDQADKDFLQQFAGTTQTLDLSNLFGSFGQKRLLEILITAYCKANILDRKLSRKDAFQIGPVTLQLKQSLICSYDNSNCEHLWTFCALEETINRGTFGKIKTSCFLCNYSNKDGMTILNHAKTLIKIISETPSDLPKTAQELQALTPQARIKAQTKFEEINHVSNSWFNDVLREDRINHVIYKNPRFFNPPEQYPPMVSRIKKHFILPFAHKAYLFIHNCGPFTLRDLQPQKLSPLKKLDLAIQFLIQLEEIHNNKLIHLDLKPDNIAFDEKMQPFIIDFGNTVESDNPLYYMVGNCAYAAPELLAVQAKNFLAFEKEAIAANPALDIYSAGIVLGRFFSDNSKFSEHIHARVEKIGHARDNAEFQKAADLARSPIDFSSLSCNDNIKDMLKKMTALNPKERPELGKIIEFFVEEKQRLILAEEDNLDLELQRTGILPQGLNRI
jgi:serine/threonine protein kinase